MSDLIAAKEKVAFSDDLSSFLDIFGDKGNTDVIFSRQLAEGLINLRGGEKFYKAQNHHLIFDSYDPKEDMSELDQIAFFKENKLEIIAVIKAMHKQVITSSFVVYIQHGLSDYLSIDDVAEALYECDVCNEKPSRNRLMVCNWMIRKCLYQLANAYAYRIENSVDINTDSNGGIIKKGRKVYSIDRIYIVDKDKINTDTISKFFGLLINGSIHWVKDKVSGMNGLNRALEPLDIQVRSNGDWGVDDGTGYPRFSKNVTRIKKDALDVFSSGSMYVTKALLAADGSLWWEIEDIKKSYL